jgi:hypothetical protein
MYDLKAYGDMPNTKNGSVAKPLLDRDMGEVNHECWQNVLINIHKSQNYNIGTANGLSLSSSSSLYVSLISESVYNFVQSNIFVEMPLLQLFCMLDTKIQPFIVTLSIASFISLPTLENLKALLNLATSPFTSVHISLIGLY